MTKLVLSDVQNLENQTTAVGTINANSALIEAAMDNTLSRDGASPNEMHADLDMNSNRIINLLDPVSNGEPITKGYALDHYTEADVDLAKQWAMNTTSTVDGTEYSSKEYAVGTQRRGQANGSSSKDWANYIGGTVDNTEFSSKEYAIGVNNRGLSGGGSSKDWANYTGGTVDNSEYSSKKYAQDAASEAADAASSASDASTYAAAAAASSTLQCTATYANVGGFGQFTLTPITTPPGSATDGMKVRFIVPTGLDRTGAFQVQLSSLTGMLLVYAPDQVNLLQYDDICQNEYITLVYRSSTSRWVIESAPLSLLQTVFGHGTVKLQASSNQALSLTQEDGNCILLYRTSAQAFRPYHFSSLTNSNVFAAQNYVEGVANQALANNTLYNVYLFDNAGTPTMDFYRCYTGVNDPAWVPVVNDIGIYVRPTVSNGATPDPRYVFIGTIWTAGGDLTTVLSGSTIISRCQSHYKVWRFPFVTDVSTVSGFTSGTFATQSAPRVEFVTEGITDTGQVILHCNAFADTAGAIVSARLNMTGTAWNGTSFSATSPEAHAHVPAINYSTNLCTAIGMAVPRGRYTVQYDLKVSTGTAQFDTWLTGVIAN